MTNPQAMKEMILDNQTLEQLVEQFEMTTTLNGEHIPTVRGWLMDEIESRNPEGFNKFLDGFYKDSELRNFVL